MKQCLWRLASPLAEEAAVNGDDLGDVRYGVFRESRGPRSKEHVSGPPEPFQIAALRPPPHS
jgi:hypothetical protein